MLVSFFYKIVTETLTNSDNLFKVDDFNFEFLSGFLVEGFNINHLSLEFFIAFFAIEFYH